MNSRISSSNASNDEQVFVASPVSISPLISSQLGLIHGAAFFRQPLSPRPKFPSLTETTEFVRNLGKNVSSNLDRCFKIVEDFVSRNGFQDWIMSIDSIRLHHQIGFHMSRRNPQNAIVMHNSNFAAILPGDSVAGMVVTSGISNFLNIYNTLLIVRLVLTWFPNAPPAIVSPLSTLCDPYLNIFRGIIPPLGGTLDLSPILAFLVLNAFTSTAAALPAELPSSSQKKWMTRLTGGKSKRPGGEQ